MLGRRPKAAHVLAGAHDRAATGAVVMRSPLQPFKVHGEKRHIGESVAEPEVIVELEDVAGRTKMVMTHAGIPEDSPGASGWAMGFDKLAAYVEEQSAS